MHDSNGGPQTEDVGYETCVEVHLSAMAMVAGEEERRASEDTPCSRGHSYIPGIKSTQQSYQQTCRNDDIKTHMTRERRGMYQG